MKGRKTLEISEVMKVLLDDTLIYGHVMTLGEIVIELADTTERSATTIRTMIKRLFPKR